MSSCAPDSTGGSVLLTLNAKSSNGKTHNSKRAKLKVAKPKPRPKPKPPPSAGEPPGDATQDLFG